MKSFTKTPKLDLTQLNKLQSLFENLCSKPVFEGRLRHYYRLLGQIDAINKKDTSLAPQLNQLLYSIHSIVTNYAIFLDNIDSKMYLDDDRDKKKYNQQFITESKQLFLKSMASTIEFYGNKSELLNNYPDLNESLHNALYHLSANALELVIEHNEVFQTADDFPTAKLKTLVASADHEITSTKPTIEKFAELSTVLSVTTHCFIAPSNASHQKYNQQMSQLLTQRTFSQVFYDAVQNLIDWLGNRINRQPNTLQQVPSTSQDTGSDKSKPKQQEVIKPKSVRACVGGLQGSLPPTPVTSTLSSRL